MRYPTNMSSDRLPPHSQEAELGVLGSVLQSPDTALPEAVELFHGKADAFYDLRNQSVFAAMLDMFEQRVPVDIISLQQWLKDRNLLDECGGIAFIASLPEAAPSSANLSYYANIVYEKHLLRRVIHTCTNTIGRLYDYEGEVDGLLDDVEASFFKITEERNSGETPAVKDLVALAVNQVEEWVNNKGKVLGIPTGLADLDSITYGLRPGEFIILAGRPSSGKTSLAMQIAEFAAVEHNIPTGVFSLEMTGESLITRMICGIARVNLHTLRREGELSARDFPRLTGASAKVAKAPLYVDDAAGISIMQLRAKARRMAQRHGIKFLVVDYLQMLHASGRKENRQQEISEISQGLKNLAKELKVPVLALSQLNREVENRPDGTPRLSDLRESGSLEQDSDVVGLLYVKKSKKEDADEEDGNNLPVGLLIAKQRNGPTGEVHLVFRKEFTRFESVSKIDDADIPEHPQPYKD